MHKSSNNKWTHTCRKTLVSILPINYLTDFVVFNVFFFECRVLMPSRGETAAVPTFWEKTPKTDCRLITTCVLNTIFFLFSRVIRGTMPQIYLTEHVLRQIVLLSTQDNSQCDVAIILAMTQECVSKVLRRNGQTGRPDQRKRGAGVDRSGDRRYLHPMKTVTCFVWGMWIIVKPHPIMSTSKLLQVCRFSL